MKDNLNWTSNQYTFTNLLLSDFQTYFSTVEAVATTGSVKVSTDGVTIVNNSTELEGVIVNDGPICSDAIVLNRSHHSQDVILNCKVDINYQISTTTLQAKWNYPNNLTDVINNVYWSIDRRSAVGDVWFQFRDFSYIGSQKHIAVSGLDLQPGLKYRFSMKFCAHSICFPTISSDGVTVVPSYPIIGSIEVHLEDQKIIVIFAMMYDPDIEDRTESIDAIESYEWTITDNFVDGKQFEKWGLVDHIQAINNTHFKAEIPLSGDIDFAKCKHVTIRGTNKVGVWSVISAEIKQCHVEDGQRQVVPRIVIDAIGDGEIDSGMGKNINLETNAAWPLLDEDYTPFKNVLSAVWPTLRHTSYQWGVIQIKSIDAQTFYKELTDIVISDPCSHPDSVQCGQTEDNYVNAMFNKTKYLIHGGRYSICIHAPETVIEHEKWTETLETVTSCSDGVTVDLTPPVPGRVWVGADPLVAYQTSSSDLYVAWDSFIDVEDTDHSMHFSGIRQYSISIGSIEGGNDLIDRRNVGLTNHMSFHSLQLQNGHKYFVTLRGFDMIGRYSEIRANPITVDTTPPEWTGESISISGRLLSNLSEIEACWENVFMDSQSGIDHFIWGVGSMIGIDDIIPFSMTFQECAIPVQGESYVLSEGQPYFITITAFDRAKLSTTRSSWAYIYDISPPTAGHVYDGRNDNIHTSTKDIDFQTNMTHLFFRWEGFHDPHSVIKYYSVHIGTCPGCNNVMTEQTVGVHTDFTLHSFHIEAGIKYFGTVVACNTGNLCTAVTSDGVIIDNSPPVPGVVQDGTNVYDNEYQSLRNFLSAKWFGFTDAQSEIDYFVIRVGTARGSGDIYPPRIITAHDMVLLTDLPEPLHLNRRIYTTIRAYNKAGLYSESTSNGVTVDISGPDIIEKPYFTRDLGSIVEGTSVLRSTLRLQWRVDDLQSSIHRQYLSLSSHMYGEMNTSRIMLNGIAREYTLTGLDLNDGSSYYVKLIVCNGAQICTETETDKILVDSTPPSSGMFAISTSHAANLQRHTQGWMTWSDYRLNIALLGFIDLHTDIDKYYVSVGRDFMTDNLNKVPGTPMVFYHNDSTPEYLDEGPIQLFVVPTQQLNNVDTVFISAWGVNKVGLCSYMIHYQFQLVSGGYLDLLRRCTPLTCLGHCVCSSLGARCHPNGDSCSDVSADNKNTLITVSDLTDFSGSNDNDIQFTPSNSHLSAKWEIVKRQGLSPLWYEWSVGLSSQESPRGVINTTTDPLWHYSGQKMEVIYCLKRGQQLSELLTYSIFVRVWYSSNAYATFKSNGVTVVSEPVAVNRQRGAAVVEKNPAFWKSDVDFIKPGSVFTMNWENVFIGSSGMIEKFNVYLSTFEGGADLHKVNEDIDSSTSAVNISRLNMLPGVRYYSNVVAYTFSGLQTTVSSDGIMIDNSPPVTGVVDDGLGLHDIDFQNKSDVVAATWHGFTDIGAGIEIYFWCVGTNKMDQTCDVLPLKNVGIQTSVSSMLPNHLQNGQQVFSKLMAVDGVGHTTDMISSNGVTIDTTPPVPISFIHADANLVVNPSFEESKGCFMEIMDISDYHICDVDNCYNPSLWNGDGCVATIKSDVDTAYDGRSFIFLKGVLQQNIQQLSPGNLYRVTFVTSHLPISGAVVSNIEGSVMFNDKEHVFHIFPKENKSDISWHLHTFYFKPKTDDGDIKITNRDKNLGFLIDCIKIQKADIQPSSEIESTVHVHTVGLHRWSSIHASWNFEDSESPISEYIWAIGYTKGNEEMQRFQSVGANNFAYNYNLTLPHASQVFVTVVAKNSAGLRYAAYSSGLNIDQTPPVIDKIHDGAGVDIDGQTSNIITANWDASDTESGLEYCEWSIGLQPYGNELQPFTKTVNLKSASATLDESIISQKTVYATVRCHNNAGSYSSSTSDGVTISNIPPSSDHAAITVIPQSLTEYSPGYFHQQDKQSVRIKWSGFTDQFNIMSFVVQFEGEKMYLKNSILDINKQVSYFVMNGLDLPDAVYTTNVVAINSMYIRSSRLTTNVTVQSSAPTVVEGSNITTTKKGDDITLSWTNCFTYPGRLVYEVSVGTVQGGADVIQWQETTENIMIIKLTEKLKTKVNLNLYCFIRAIGESGIFSSKSDDVNT
ncbi:uncharacterized protein LOC143046127 [Mytilus galloprovincialis]|uniref:uncharacterized protein LOC143046127 n=1 Tax=Mytilus galloprovincialis TaxID=29158 RepID=UPI003F7C4DDC